MPELVHLGRRPYREVWELQQSRQRELIAGQCDEVVYFVEHDPPVVTLGKSTKVGNLLVSEKELEERGIDIFRIERGGDVTWHGPGQLVVYPILDLNRHKRDVHWYMRALEEVIIASLAEFGLKGVRSKGNTGVWVENTENIDIFPLLKIASLGVRISRWVTLHGFSITIFDYDEGFRPIKPCGFDPGLMTSLEREKRRRNEPINFTFSDVESVVERNFLELFYPQG